MHVIIKRLTIIITKVKLYYTNQGGVTVITPLQHLYYNLQPQSKCFDQALLNFLLLHCIGITILGFNARISLNLDHFYHKHQRDIVA